jgi:hypothetical protein
LQQRLANDEVLGCGLSIYDWRSSIPSRSLADGVEPWLQRLQNYYISEFDFENAEKQFDQC